MFDFGSIVLDDILVTDGRQKPADSLGLASFETGQDLGTLGLSERCHHGGGSTGYGSRG